MNRFFLDADNGALAFKKINDYPDVDNSLYSGDAISGGWDAYPASYIDTDRVLDVTNYPEAIIIFKRSDSGATFNFNVLMGIPSSNMSSPSWFIPDNGTYTSIDKDLIIAVNCRYCNYLSIEAVSVSAGTLSIEMIPLAYETST